jgi:hypothetical protein
VREEVELGLLSELNTMTRVVGKGWNVSAELRQFRAAECAKGAYGEEFSPKEDGLVRAITPLSSHPKKKARTSRATGQGAGVVLSWNRVDRSLSVRLCWSEMTPRAAKEAKAFEV